MGAFDMLGGVLGIGQDTGKDARNALSGQAQQAGGFADTGQAGYGAYGAQGQSALDYLRGQMSGANSVSAEQLRQGLQSNLAAQQSMAASASPQNAAMAARQAMMNGARLGYGMSGQAATAGLQERNQAAQQYAALLQALRGQDLQAALGGRQTAVGGYGAALGNPAPTAWSQMGPAVSAGLGYAAMSDERAKKDVEDGDEEANRLMRGLKAHRFRYKDERNGAGEQLGVMAQALERAGAKHTVIDTPRGKMVDGAKLATTNTAMLSALERRVRKLEGR
jgi:hypothetical protein